MDSIFLNQTNSFPQGEISIGGSKSETNRLLILNELYGKPLQIENLSDSEDTNLLLDALNETGEKVDIHHAGTAMRFLTAYFAIQKNRKLILTGSERMKQRPIGTLVEALRSLGADISYIENEGYPPLLIQGKKITKDFVELNAGISSQFITALMLIAPKLEQGLTIQLNGKITSQPYITMTIHWLKKLGIEAEQVQNQITINPKNEINPNWFYVESDWSSASYFYAVAALSTEANIKLKTYFSDSIQGDSALIHIYKSHFGVETRFDENRIILTKKNDFKYRDFELNLNDTPDLAQTIAVTCAGLKIKSKLTGLETLTIKETDRLHALQKELIKVGAFTKITKDTLEILEFREFNQTPFIETYNDHRMAMSFAPLCVMNDIEIENPSVVEKSYPNFWKDLDKLFF